MTLALAQLPAWPAALTEDEALAYTRVGRAVLADWRKRGLVHFVRRGHKGELIVSLAELDAALRQMFGEASNDISTDFDFGD